MISFLVALCLLCLLSLFAFGVVSIGVADVLTKAKFTQGYRDKIMDILVESNDAKPTAWKETLMYGISCRPCVSFWVAMVQAIILCSIWSIPLFIPSVWMTGYVGGRIFNKFLPE